MKTPIIAIAALLSGCAMFDSPPGSQLQHTWDGDEFSPIQNVKWVLVTPTELYKNCGLTKGACVERVYEPGDARVCIIRSTLTRDEAEMVSDVSNSMSLRYHEEEMHCRRGLTHRRK